MRRKRSDEYWPMLDDGGGDLPPGLWVLYALLAIGSLWMLGYSLGG